MGSSRLFARVMLVMVAMIIVGGVGVGIFANKAPEFGAGQAVVESTTSMAGAQFGVVSPSSGSAVPSTVVLGMQPAATETETITSTASTTVAGTSTQLSSSVSSPNGTGASSSGHSIEFFGNIAIDVKDPSASLQQVSAIAAGLGGYVAATSYDSAQNGSASMTLMVPAQNFQNAIVQLQGLGTVVNIQSSSDDVTVQYQDLNATLSSLLTEQGSLLKLLNQSDAINSTIQIESILQQTDAQINSIESQILQTAQLVDYATVSVTLETAAKSTTPAPLSMKLSATPRTGLGPLSVTFDAIVAGGVGPYVVNYNFGDGTSSEGQQLIHQFGQPGIYNVTVSATDQTGNVTLASVIVNVIAPPATSGLSTFAGSVWALFTGVVEGIVEVAVVVIPLGLVALGAYVTVWRRYSKMKEPTGVKGESKA
ncbi:MAG: DUF4349 domain-containing protein [Thaumarchaeota archaeon]|nr:DUF4349 domain-containing protein [Nitrososphaerota archaeon]